MNEKDQMNYELNPEKIKDDIFDDSKFEDDIFDDSDIPTMEEIAKKLDYPDIEDILKFIEPMKSDF